MTRDKRSMIKYNRGNTENMQHKNILFFYSNQQDFAVMYSNIK